MSAKAAIEYLCNCLAYFGITTLNPEVFRQAKLGNTAVADRLWQALYELVVLHYNMFECRLAHAESVDLGPVRPLVTYILYRWECPVTLALKDSLSLLLAFGFAVSYTDLYKHYEANTRLLLPRCVMPASLNHLAEQALESRSLDVSSSNGFSLLSLVNLVKRRIFSCYEQIKYTTQLVKRVKASCQGVDAEDLYFSANEARVQEYKIAMQAHIKQQELLKEERNFQRIFWEWMVKSSQNSVAEAIEGERTESQDRPQEVSDAEFQAILYNFEAYYQATLQRWEKVGPLLSKITNKWITLITDLQQVLPNDRLPEIEAVVRNIESNLSQQFIEFNSLAEKLLNQSRIPIIVCPLSQHIDRSAGEEMLKSRLDEMKEELRHTHEENVKLVMEKLSSLSDLSLFNLCSSLFKH